MYKIERMDIKDYLEKKIMGRYQWCWFMWK